MTVTLCSRARPQGGTVTVALPIPDEEYADCIRRLQKMGMGAVMAQDCKVARVDGGLPVLRHLEGERANIDELDYLARQTEKLSKRDAAKYQATVCAYRYTRTTDLLNLSSALNFQKTTVVTDFSDWSKIGREHYLTHHPKATRKELDKVDFERVALELILGDRSGRITPYGVAYDRNPKLRLVYDGRTLPALNDHDGVMELSVAREEQWRARSEITFLRLPMSDLKLERMLERGGIMEGEKLMIGVANIGCDFQELPAVYDTTPLRDFNRLALTLSALSQEDREKLVAVKGFARATEAAQIVALAENLTLFDVDGETVSYHGDQSLDELMAPKAPEQGMTMEMGGMG